jgi:hypothetical protein
MHQELSINRASVDKILGQVRPLSTMCREIGLAAVAAELHFQIEDLELETADAVERGAAALFLAGFSPKPATQPRAAKHGARFRRAMGAARSRRLRAVKPTVRGH